MNEAAPSISLSGLSFTGKDKEPARVELRAGLNVLYGASNTGKSFTVKTIDFLLGGSRALPGISERYGYERGWLALNLPKSGASTLMRALAGGSLELFPGHVRESDPKTKDRRRLSAKHSAASSDNVSQFLLGELGLSGQMIAEDVY
jgi:hypothetical protein